MIVAKNTSVFFKNCMDCEKKQQRLVLTFVVFAFCVMMETGM